MSVELKYKHQEKTYKLMREELKRSGKVAYVYPTGGGKTFPILKYIEDEPQKTVLIVVPTQIIKNQYKKYIKQYIKNGKSLLKNKQVEIITYAKLSLVNKIAKKYSPRVCVLDEAHRIGAETYEPAVDNFMKQNPQTEMIAISATPERTDGRNMLYEKFGNHIVYEMSLTEALSGEKEGEVILKAPRYIRVLSELIPVLKEYKKRIDLETNQLKKEDLIKKYQKLESLVSNSPSIQDIMEQGMTRKNGKYIVYCKNSEELLEKMQMAKEIFGKVNSKIKADYILSRNESGIGKTEKENRITLDNFENSKYGEELQLLFCVDMLNEGKHIDRDNIDGEIMFRETESSIVYKQQIGRVMIVDDTEGDKVIIDAVNNWIRQLESFKELEAAERKGIRNEKSGYTGNLALSPEETEFIEILREIGEETKYNYFNTYEDVIRWLDSHNGRLPRCKIYRKTKVSEMTEEELEEKRLYGRWSRTEERRLLEEYRGKDIKEVPKEYRDRIAKLRSYGLGMPHTSIFDEYIDWLETHDGRKPRGNMSVNGKNISIKEMPEDRRKEQRLYSRWLISPERKIVDEYKGKPISSVPKAYRGKIRILREDFGIGVEKLSPCDEFIEWLRTHNGKSPRSGIIKDGKAYKVEEMTEEEREEQGIYARWKVCPEKKILEEYIERPLEDVPEKYRSKIRILREEFGLGLRSKKTVEDILDWLEVHNGKMPRVAIKINGKTLKIQDLTEEQRFEQNLYARWKISKEREILNEYAGRPIEDVPEEFRDVISKLRIYGQLGKNKDSVITDKLKTSVRKQVASNEKTRRELEKLSIIEKE